jgi:hypothetical protein
MSALSHKRTSADVKPMSALPPKADVDHHNSNVRSVPKTEVARTQRPRDAVQQGETGDKAKPSVFQLAGGFIVFSFRQFRSEN